MTKLEREYEINTKQTNKQTNKTFWKEEEIDKFVPLPMLHARCFIRDNYG